jgi:hypothetical protein
VSARDKHKENLEEQNVNSTTKVPESDTNNESGTPESAAAATALVRLAKQPPEEEDTGEEDANESKNNSGSLAVKKPVPGMETTTSTDVAAAPTATTNVGTVRRFTSTAQTTDNKEISGCEEQQKFVYDFEEVI